MEKENKNKKEQKEEELCCADKNVCSVDCAPKNEEENSKSESACGCGGNC